MFYHNRSIKGFIFIKFFHQLNLTRDMCLTTFFFVKILRYFS
jgi:hypothetical protein